MPAYDDQFFNPPAPLARVTLRKSGESTAVSGVPMLIDSGADVTLIPQQPVTRLSAAIDPDAGYKVAGFDGKRSIVQVVNLDLVFLERVFRGRFLVSNQEWDVVGRDVLNHVAMVLNGPRLVWDEQKSPGT